MTSSAIYVAPSHPLKAKKEYLNAAPIANTVCHPKSLGQKGSVKWPVSPVENPVKVIPIIAPTAITLVAPKATWNFPLKLTPKRFIPVKSHIVNNDRMKVGKIPKGSPKMIWKIALTLKPKRLDI